MVLFKFLIFDFCFGTEKSWLQTNAIIVSKKYYE